MALDAQSCDYQHRQDEYFSLGLEKQHRGLPSFSGLLQVIDVTRSYVTMTATKIEITMRKAEPMQWASLELPATKKPEKPKEDTAE